jgi:hypothetical protein
MASGNGDVQYGLPYTGTPVQQASRDGKVATVLDMNRLAARTITEHANDDHYTSDGHLYHE